MFRIIKKEEKQWEDVDYICDNCSCDIKIVSCDKCGVLLPEMYAKAEAEMVCGEAETIYYCTRCSKGRSYKSITK